MVNATTIKCIAYLTVCIVDMVILLTLPLVMFVLVLCGVVDGLSLLFPSGSMNVKASAQRG